MTVTALDADGNAVPNFGRESVPETIALAATLVAPAGGHEPGIALGSGFGSFVAGAAEATDVSWPEVGSIDIVPSLADGDFLGTGDVTGASHGPVGRFVPHHFDTALNTPLIESACAAGRFSYLGQPLNYSVAPTITVTARALAGELTENYTQDWFRLTTSTLTNRNYSDAAHALDTSGLPPASLDPAVTELSPGTGELTFSSGAGLRYARTTPGAPFDSDIELSIDIADEDGVEPASNPVAFSSIGFTSGNEIRYGRLRLTNATGSELVNLAVPMHIEYWDAGAGDFIANTDDVCSSGITLTLAAFTENLDAGETCVLDNGAPGISNAGCATVSPPGTGYSNPPLGGDFRLVLRAPGAGNDGSVTVTADAPVWLRYDWDAGGGEEQPDALATFGIFAGETRQIYLREVYR